MKSNAPGQLLGYTIQFSRALCHLLKSGPGDIVCVEVLGDVASVTSDGKTTTEEDKSSIARNPLTDKSTDLWKTFANWINAINSGELNVKKTKFVLYCNKAGDNGIVDKFSAAQNMNEAKSAIEEAKTILNDIKEGHAIWEDYDLVMNKNGALLLEVVERFEFQKGNGAGFDEIIFEIKRNHVSEGQIEFLVSLLSGWLYKKVIEKIAERKQAIIKWDEFDHQFKVAFDRARRMELIDFTLENPLNNDDIHQQIKIRPGYLRQLEQINVSDDDIIDAVIDFLSAKVNRDKWIEDELIDESVASDFEVKLKAFWKNKRDGIEITEKSLREDERGRLLLVECKSRQETIRDVSPPTSTIAGTYHALADKSVLGWHPNWETLFPRKEEK